jgi:Cof subfamily protein (haloacid dehalogenase superfamily)
VEVPELKYLCVFDMDGTLLDKGQLVSPENRAALKKLQSAGVGIVLATGRTELMTRKYIKDLELALPVISNNGSLVLDAKTKNILFQHTLSRDTLTKILDFAIQKNMDYFIYTIDRVYFSANSRKIRIMHAYNDLVSFEERILLHRLPDTLDSVLALLPDDGDRCVMKILVSYAVPQDCAYFASIPGVEAVSSQGDAFDIMPAGGTKGKALEFLAGYLGISKENIFAFGDNHNDLTMLEFASYAIAPANAVEEVRRMADFVTVSSEESGVAQGIEEFVLPLISKKESDPESWKILHN